MKTHSKQLLSIIKDDNYEDLENYATKAMGETGLFNLAQVCLSFPFFYFVLFLSHSNLCFLFLQWVLMMKSLMNRCASHEMVVSRLREKVEAKEMKHRELTA